MVLVISPQTAGNIYYRGYGGHRMVPLALSTGNYAVGEGTLTDRNFAQWLPLLKTGTITAAGGLTFTGNDTLVFQLSSGPVYVSAEKADYAFGVPATNVYRFSPHQGDAGWDEDPSNLNRRSEIGVFSATDYYVSGQTAWSSFSFVTSASQHAPFDDPIGYAGGGSIHNHIHQWHSVNNAIGIVLGVNMQAGNMRIYTRSSANGDGGSPGGSVTHYNAARPTDGVVHNMVLSGLVGSSGHLNVWLDGTQIVNANVPIGFYADPEPALAYLRWGIYQSNYKELSPVFIANPEWGTASLSARVTTPLSVTTPSGGWV